ncbi:uncharacterized protein I303_107740 [Kwoniella dejecticola CBS 10117]|uniref:Uncharacterized protein n=1 Tax=Kwoniella dejecticola CBS 10117 TaxID=1296121 RepID=A0A1A5ZVK1_9TREE|nr:uncharacterized protein I303_07745 [Kwoniella dejecticola CBS 10117]OBR81835.1 hypothetical protein I303_07745 [Kwoniella dejecticola CBS 10117]
MGGPNLEIFKFGFYMFFPIYAMFKFGDPEWYESYVQPYKEILWPPYESTYQPPRTHTDVKAELARMKAERIAKKTGRPVGQVTQDEIDNEGGIGIHPASSSAGITQSSSSSSSPSPSIPSQSAWSWPRGTSTDKNERLV